MCFGHHNQHVHAVQEGKPQPSCILPELCAGELSVASSSWCLKEHAMPLSQCTSTVSVITCSQLPVWLAGGRSSPKLCTKRHEWLSAASYISEPSCLQRYISHTAHSFNTRLVFTIASLVPSTKLSLLLLHHLHTQCD